MIVVLAAGVLLGALGSMPVAGAVSVFVCRRGLAGQLGPGLALATGAALAEGTWCLLVLLGADQVFTRWPTAVVVARVVGGGLLIVLGAILLTRRVLAVTADDISPPRRRLREDFWLGVTLSGLNLTIPLNMVVLCTLALSFGLRPDARPLVFALGFSLGIVSWYGLFLRWLGAVRRRLSATHLSRVPRLFGVLLLAGGVLSLVRAAR